MDDKTLPVVVRMRVECDKCGHTEDETHEFEMPRTEAKRMEAIESGKCPDCGAKVQIHLHRT